MEDLNLSPQPLDAVYRTSSPDLVALEPPQEGKGYRARSVPRTTRLLEAHGSNFREGLQLDRGCFA